LKLWAASIPDLKVFSYKRHLCYLAIAHLSFQISWRLEHEIDEGDSNIRSSLITIIDSEDSESCFHDFGEVEFKA
jgi:hypothetical protein